VRQVSSAYSLGIEDRPLTQEDHLCKSRIIMVPRWNLEGHHTQWSRNRKENHLHKFFAYDQSDMIETILSLWSQPHRIELFK